MREQADVKLLGGIATLFKRLSFGYFRATRRAKGDVRHTSDFDVDHLRTRKAEASDEFFPQNSVVWRITAMDYLP